MPLESTTTDNAFSIEEELNVSLLSAMLEKLAEEVSAKQTQYIAKQNILTFPHGRNWSGYTKHEDASSTRWEGKLKKRSTTLEIRLSEILNSDFSALIALENDLLKDITTGLERSLIETLHEATANQPAIEIDLGTDLRQGLIKLWESATIGLNEDLSPSMPSITLHPHLFEKIASKMAELQQDKEFITTVDNIKTRKWHEALCRHFENILKYNLDENERRDTEHQLRQLRKTQPSSLHQE